MMLASLCLLTKTFTMVTLKNQQNDLLYALFIKKKDAATKGMRAQLTFSH